MKITLCGSIQHIDAIKNAAKTLESLGYEVDTPNSREGDTNYTTMSEEERADFKDEIIREHLDKISESDAVFVFNKEKKGVDGYIGGNTLMEMAFAYAQHLEIFLLNPIPELSYADEIQGMKPIILNGDIQAIDAYFQGLPKTYVSSKSPIKLRGVSRGMRRAGIRTMVLPRPTESNVVEQPYNVDVTYEGATNRHEALIKELQTENDMPAYIATYEGGNHPIHKAHNTFNIGVFILEKVGSERKAGIGMSLEIPKEMTDKVPSQYPDLGVLVQEEYGSKLKDPFPYFTNGKIKRLELVENAVYNVAVQLPTKE